MPAGFVATASWKIKDGNETLYGVAVDEKDDERQLRVYTCSLHQHGCLPSQLLVAYMCASCRVRGGLCSQ